MTVLDRVCPTCGRVVMEAGAKYVVEYALDRTGEPAAKLFLEQLESRSRTRDLVSDMLIRVEAFAATGELEVPRELNHLRGDLWELKARTLRLPFYYLAPGSCAGVRITHGFIKRGEKTPRKELDRGEAIIREDRNR